LLPARGSDAFLALWSEARAGYGVEALPVLKRDIDAWWAARGWDSRVILKAHFGRAVIGPFGTEARFDVIGNEVNVAVTLPARTVSLSAEAFGASRTESARRSGSTRRRWCTFRWTIRGLDRAISLIVVGVLAPIIALRLPRRKARPGAAGMP
jgi:hypothetical protein